VQGRTVRLATPEGWKTLTGKCFAVLIICRAQRDFLTSKLEDVEGKLREAKADRRESERERAMTKALDMMKELFQGEDPCRLQEHGDHVLSFRVHCNFLHAQSPAKHACLNGQRAHDGSGLNALPKCCRAGVHGRVTELANATSKKYNIALAVLLARDMDSVVVKDEAVAKDCIKLLKDRKAPPMTFYPLNSVRVSNRPL
jgi:chromosome segregation ATPase